MSEPPKDRWQLVGAAVGVLLTGILYLLCCLYGPQLLTRLMRSF